MHEKTPLSEDERRALRDIERHLSADPYFASFSLNRKPSRRPAIGTVASGAVMVVGVVLALAGVLLTPQSIGVGVTVVVAGILVFVASVVLWFGAHGAAGRSWSG